MILADESLDFRIVKALRQKGLNVTSILENSPGITDKEVVALTKEGNYLLDKDFGKWVFAHKYKISVILLRYNVKNIDQIIKTLTRLLTEKSDQFSDTFTTVTEQKIRRRKL